MVATPVDFSATPWGIERRAPETGEHTEEILLELGKSWEQISTLRDSGALG
jgi:crotonobetainyl-CoA:carnitine CoA-transferase CaiB-like acyl-CoA transferase